MNVGYGAAIALLLFVILFFITLVQLRTRRRAPCRPSERLISWRYARPTGCVTQPYKALQSRTVRTARTRARRNLVAHIVLILFVIGALFPFYWMVATSIKTLSESLQSPPTLLPQHCEFKNYAQCLSCGAVWTVSL